ncbi:MAG: PorT family protein [Hymenobacter sp.]|nr:MAG: PorT family protein [Hymenobacter sp.]
MNNLFTAPLLTSSLLLLSTVAHAQAAFSIGPQVGLNIAGATNTSPDNITLTYRAGCEVGLQSVVQFGHLAVQPSLRFSQKGLHRHYGYNFGNTETDYRVNYLSLPVNMAYSLRSDGLGIQVFAGPYLSLLLGGNYQFASSSGSSSSSEGKIKAGEYYAIPAPGTTTYDVLLRRFDAGLQAGLGYRVGPVLAQVDFAFGLTDLAPTFTSAYNRTAQVSLSYLFTPKQ